jgi:hypothetical protein
MNITPPAAATATTRTRRTGFMPPTFRHETVTVATSEYPPAPPCGQQVTVRGERLGPQPDSYRHAIPAQDREVADARERRRARCSMGRGHYPGSAPRSGPEPPTFWSVGSPGPFGGVYGGRLPSSAGCSGSVRAVVVPARGYTVGCTRRSSRAGSRMVTVCHAMSASRGLVGFERQAIAAMSFTSAASPKPARTTHAARSTFRSNRLDRKRWIAETPSAWSQPSITAPAINTKSTTG